MHARHPRPDKKFNWPTELGKQYQGNTLQWLSTFRHRLDTLNTTPHPSSNPDGRPMLQLLPADLYPGRQSWWSPCPHWPHDSGAFTADYQVAYRENCHIEYMAIFAFGNCCYDHTDEQELNFENDILYFDVGGSIWSDQ